MWGSLRLPWELRRKSGTLVIKQSVFGSGYHLSYLVLFAALALLSFGFLVAWQEWMSSWACMAVLGLGALLFVLLLIAPAWQRTRPLGSAKSYLSLALVLWWSILVSEEVFYRYTLEEQSFAGHFSEAAYGAVAFWGVAFLALCVIVRGRHLGRMFSGDTKWLSLFALLCCISAPFSPTPLYSLAWAFKLLLVVLLLLLASAVTHDEKDIESFLWVNLWGLLVLCTVPVARAFLNPTGAFGEDGRLWGSPDGLSIITGVLALLALTLYTLCRRSWLVGVVVFGTAVMIMSGGKAGIVAGMISIMAFFVMRKRFATGFGWLLAMIGIGGVVLATTPLASHFRTYQEEGQLSTITGRTDLWKAAWPEILRRPIVGHGYLASRFVSEHVEGSFPEAGHLHNGFIDTLYNTGIIGFTILIIIHLAIVRNLWWVLKRAPGGNARLLAVGSCAIYGDLLINGLFNSTFGGHAGSPFILFLGLLMISQKLREMTVRAV